MIPVPGGTFVMGSNAGRPDESPRHRVSLPRFEIGRTPVTNADYAVFLGRTGATPPPWWGREAFDAPDQPVVGITWYDATAYASWLSEGGGAPWRLPTEAEWELAARGGLDEAATPWGEHVPEAELPEGPLRGPWRVGQGTPNGFGLCDMGTIVHEWCLDWYKPDYYAESPAERPSGPPEGERRASRGGSWRHHVRWSSPAARSSLPPGFRYADYGFRVLREA